ncbi:DUF1330 domain-containing protein [Acinetobacter pittii]|uniref:DUF1330 domain-containing protein n=1 Tax=Acinetobacter pittii TaxID=48296 RepID=UPI0021D34672|nr:DUF1330 domain-containing protein [Acinetobacter pittii]MCU4528183.1 DUF1330 domain-containing protein [Acinetobacter pittii]
MSTQSKGYVLAIIDVFDPQTFSEYTSRTPSVIEEFGGHFVLRGTEYELMESSSKVEGNLKKNRIVLVEFNSVEIARQFYNSTNYQFAATFRRASAFTELYILSEYLLDNMKLLPLEH